MLSDAVRDHFQSPRNAGKLSNATACVDVTNPVCGDILYLAARLEPETNCISEARFLCQGCTTAIACASLLTVELKNRTIHEAAHIDAEYLSHQLGGLPSATLHAAQLAADALTQLLAKLKSR
ncbi:MAG TPA: iron-sulfur cluster assembly scaffold protein [Methylomirabilota bacterium]|jgi:NifU-like protein involved in Fe-S cluster formation|nr:iron-sulfur cluster assembly scaffold protein [Methylomirabilota bacterium]